MLLSFDIRSFGVGIEAMVTCPELVPITKLRSAHKHTYTSYTARGLFYINWLVQPAM